jgi:hypothetical protein
MTACVTHDALTKYQHCDGPPKKENYIWFVKSAYGKLENNLGCENMFSIWGVLDSDYVQNTI